MLSFRTTALLPLTTLVAVGVAGSAAQAATPPNYQVRGQAVVVKTKTLNLEIQVYSPTTVRILRAPVGGQLTKTSLSVLEKPITTKFDVKETGDELTVNTAGLRVLLNTKTGLVRFVTLANVPIMREVASDSLFVPASDVGKPSYSVQQRFGPAKEEALYGLGQFQAGILNWRNHHVQLRQENQYIANPLLVSTAGYGILWDNTSTTNFRDDARGASFTSEIGDVIDYYFIYGRNADGVVAGYRTLTGQAPMPGKWALGFWQCRERYESQEQLVDVVKKYRALGVPLDNIVQDWQYWGTDNHNWNSTEFGNPKFPDPKKMVDEVHAMNAHIMISVWPSFGDKTAIYKELKDNNMLYKFKNWPPDGGVLVYDAFNPKARDIYWRYMNKNIFSLGMDAWWLDASEPEQFDRKGAMDSTQTALGSFKRMRNAFPLEHVKSVYENQRAVTSDKRVFILTRSAFAGQQRYGAAVWSGDIQGSWDAFRKQIAGGLNFSLTGIPYWTTDIGGFFTDKTYPIGVTDPGFQEMYVRWFQFGAFSPLFRSHGTNTPREIYQFGNKGTWAFDAQAKFVDLRYRLLPYIYSMSWQVTNNSYTPMRALAMDFAADSKVHDINDEYMFGPALLVNPVTKAQYTTASTTPKEKATTDFSAVKSQTLYLPKGADWFDFWTGKRTTGGQNVTTPTPIDQLPLYVRAGSILPMGPVVQYAAEPTTAPMELRVYPGADAEFVLYEDENDSYRYEKGVHATIPLRWNEKTQQLTIGRRVGTFPGMATTRTFNVVFVDATHGVGPGTEAKPQQVVSYKGEALTVKRSK